MAKTLRLLSTYNGNRPGTIVRVPDDIAAQLLQGNNASEDITGGKAPPPAPLPVVRRGNSRSSLRGAMKWFGAAQNAKTFNETGVFATANYGAGQKLEAEAPFTAVRLYWVSRAANAMTGSRALVGVTETADTSNAAQAFHPRIDGATHNAVVTPPNTLGWRQVTWAGASTVDHPAANAAAQVKVSDWIPLTSVPRADGGTRPLLLIRAEHDGAAGGGFATYFNANITPLRTPNAAARGRILQLFTGSGMVTNVGSANGTISTAAFEIYPEFRYAVPSLTVAGVGDSTLQLESVNLTGVITNWGWRACADVSSVDRPVNWLNSGASGKQFIEFWARFQELVASGLAADALVVQPLSYNDYSADPTNLAYYAEVGKSRAQQVHEFAQANRIANIIYQGLLPANILTAAADIQRREYNEWLRQFAANTNAQYLDFSALGDGALPERWVTAYNSGGDGIHPNELGVEVVMTPALASCLRNIL